MRVSRFWIYISGLTLLAATVAFATLRFPILDPDHVFECSVMKDIGCSGVLPSHAAGDSEMALLLDKEHGLTGEVSLAARLQALQRAQHSIRIQALVFSGDEAGLRVADILKQKKKAHPEMDIRVIVDAASNPTIQTQNMYYDLKQNLIEVEGYETGYLQWVNEISTQDPFRFNKRFHDKMWIIDGEDDAAGVAVVGGLNVANEYFRVDMTPKNHWRDQDVIVRGGIVKDIVKSFDRNYAYFKEIKAAKPGLFNTDLAWSKWRKILKKTGTLSVSYKRNPVIAAEVEKAFTRPIHLNWLPATMRFVQSRPRFKEDYILQNYLGLIQASAHPGGEILIANAYFIPEPEISEALKAAAYAGARVVVLTNSYETNDLQQMTYASRYLYQDLIHAGVEIWEYTGAQFGEGTLHAKFAVFDRVAALVGSYNLDARSQRLNSETALVFESPELAGTLSDQYLNHDLAKSSQVSAKQAAEWHNEQGVKALNVQLSLKLVPML